VEESRIPTGRGRRMTQTLDQIERDMRHGVLRGVQTRIRSGEPDVHTKWPGHREPGRTEPGRADEHAVAEHPRRRGM
jgi:hypothetical protein